MRVGDRKITGPDFEIGNLGTELGVQSVRAVEKLQKNGLRRWGRFLGGSLLEVEPRVLCLV